MSQPINIAINGFGRIGRIAFRIASANKNIKVVAINDLIPIDQLAYLLKYDTVHGQFNGKISIKDNAIIVNGQTIRVTAERNPENLDWNTVNVDVVLECTGIFKDHKKAAMHLNAGAKKVVISAPSTDAPMYVMGVNQHLVKASEKVVSNASCTTNCLATLVKVIHDNFEITEGLMTTVHAVTASQSIVDAPAKKNKRIGRSAINNIIPTSTGAATAVTKVIPELKGKLSGMAFRVPTNDVSVVDLTVRVKKGTSLKKINSVIQNASENELSPYLGYTEDEVVSQDFVSDSRSCIFDSEASMELNEKFFKFIAWYDNEYGYSNRLIDLALYIARLK